MGHKNQALWSVCRKSRPIELCIPHGELGKGEKVICVEREEKVGTGCPSRTATSYACLLLEISRCKSISQNFKYLSSPHSKIQIISSKLSLLFIAFRWDETKTKLKAKKKKKRPSSLWLFANFQTLPTHGLQNNKIIHGPDLRLLQAQFAFISWKEIALHRHGGAL